MKKSLTYGVIGASIAAVLSIGALAFGLFPGNTEGKLPEIIVSPKQVLAGPQVALVAESVSGIDDGKSLNYHWTQLSGDKVLISNDNSSRLVFSIDPAKTDRILSFRVDATDGNITRSSVAQVTVLANEHPSANAGKDFVVYKNQLARLDGTKSFDPENETLSYKWSQTEGPVVELSGGDTTNASFVASSPSLEGDSSAILTFQLIVNDGMYDSKPDLVKVKLQTGRPQIVSTGGDQTVSNGELVKLNATLISDSQVGQFTYAWNQTSGPAVKLSDPNSQSPTFIAPALKANKTLSFRVIVSDGTFESKPAYTKVIVQADKAPIADPGSDIIVGSGDQAMLDGTKSSDPENNTLTYRWNQTSGPAVTLSDPTSANPTFIAPTLANATSKILSFKLLVSDGTYDSKPDYVKVTVVSRMPIANGGPNQIVKGGANVTLDGTQSKSPDGDRLTYLWSQTSGPSVTLSHSTSANSTFIAPSKGTTDKVMTFQLVVNNNNTSSKPYAVTVTVLANKPPVADAGVDQTYNDRDVVLLDGSKSYDPEGDKLTFKWIQISGRSVVIKYGNLDQAVFNAPAVSSDTVLKFQLTVSDGVASKTDTVSITIRPS